jgi:hypothetical protein
VEDQRINPQSPEILTETVVSKSSLSQTCSAKVCESELKLGHIKITGQGEGGRSGLCREFVLWMFLPRKHLSHSTSFFFFAFIYLSDRASHFLPRQASDHDPPSSVSHITGITDVHPHAWFISRSGTGAQAGLKPQSSQSPPPSQVLGLQHVPPHSVNSDFIRRRRETRVSTLVLPVHVIPPAM